MKILTILLTLALTLGLLLAGCQPIQPLPAAVDSVPAPGSAVKAMDIILPSGEVCLWAGQGATLAFDGERVNYVCDPDQSASRGNEIVLLGDPVAEEETVWTVTRGIVTRENEQFVLAESAPVTFFLAQLDLADESVCLHAGFGATFAAADQRVNWTCGDAEPLQVVAGPLSPGGMDEAGVYYALKAQVSSSDAGFVTDSSESVPVIRITGADLP
jgi:hypothetical protein